MLLEDLTTNDPTPTQEEAVLYPKSGDAIKHGQSKKEISFIDLDERGGGGQNSNSITLFIAKAKQHFETEVRQRASVDTLFGSTKRLLQRASSAVMITEGSD